MEPVRALRRGPQPFKINVPEEILADLRERLAHTRWPDEVDGAGWDYGTELTYMQELVDYWLNEYDWRAQEAALNQFAHFRTEIDGLAIHFIHQLSNRRDAVPVLLLHGWPSSFVQMLKLIPLLTQSKDTGRGSLAFDVVVPSLIGFGLSDRAWERGMSLPRMARYFHELMRDLNGYDRFAIRAGDVGAGVAEQMALAYPEEIIGLHISGTRPFYQTVPSDMTEAEKLFVANVRRWRRDEMAYASIQSTKPQTAAYGLNDSPAGMAAWIIEKFRTWSDCDGDVEKRFTKDELLTNLTIYWVTETIGSSMRVYYESMRDYGISSRVNVPTAYLMPDKDFFPTPREWVERTSRVDRWNETSRGGHFLEWEEPELVAGDMREFFGSVRPRDELPSIFR